MKKKIIAEVGAGDGNNCKSKEFFNQEEFEIHLFEPNPLLFKYLKNKTKDFNNIKCYNLALFNYDGEVDFILDSQWSFIKGLYSPSKHSFSRHWSGGMDAEEIFKDLIVKVKCNKISEILKEEIEILYLDCEGSEFSILTTLVQYPKFITLTSLNDAGYVLPNDVYNWLNKNNYSLVGHSHADNYFKRLN